MNVKFIILLVFSLNLFSSNIDVEFKKFFNSSFISDRLCKQNTYHFVNHLIDKKINLSDAYVVSVHDEFQDLNNFDSRWGRKEFYPSGEQYFRSNWFYHFFLVANGKVYDFSQADIKTESLYDYLLNSYIPKEEIKLVLGNKFNEKIAIKSFVNTKLQIHSIANFSEDLDTPIYEGSFIELFAYSSDKEMISNLTPTNKLELGFDRYDENENGSITIYEPYGVHENKKLGLITNPTMICKSYGFLGSVPVKSEHIVKKKQDAIKLSGSMKTSTPFDFEDGDFITSYSITETMPRVKTQPLFHIAKKVTCSDLNTVLNNL